MKIIGFVFVGIGIALFLFVGYTFLKEKGKVISPIPEEKGIRVIFVSPTP